MLDNTFKIELALISMVSGEEAVTRASSKILAMLPDTDKIVDPKACLTALEKMQSDEATKLSPVHVQQSLKHVIELMSQMATETSLNKDLAQKSPLLQSVWTRMAFFLRFQVGGKAFAGYEAMKMVVTEAETKHEAKKLTMSDIEYKHLDKFSWMIPADQITKCSDIKKAVQVAGKRGVSAKALVRPVHDKIAKADDAAEKAMKAMFFN